MSRWDHRCPKCNHVIYNGEGAPVCYGRCERCRTILSYVGDGKWVVADVPGRGEVDD